MATRFYRVRDPYAALIAGVPIDADRIVELSPEQARYPLDQRQIYEMEKTAPLPPAPGVDSQPRKRRGRR